MKFFLQLTPISRLLLVSAVTIVVVYLGGFVVLGMKNGFKLIGSGGDVIGPTPLLLWVVIGITVSIGAALVVVAVVSAFGGFRPWSRFWVSAIAMSPFVIWGLIALGVYLWQARTTQDAGSQLGLQRGGVSKVIEQLEDSQLKARFYQVLLDDSFDQSLRKDGKLDPRDMAAIIEATESSLRSSNAKERDLAAFLRAKLCVENLRPSRAQEILRVCSNCRFEVLLHMTVLPSGRRLRTEDNGFLEEDLAAIRRAIDDEERSQQAGEVQQRNLDELRRWLRQHSPDN